MDTTRSLPSCLNVNLGFNGAKVRGAGGGGGSLPPCLIVWLGFSSARQMVAARRTNPTHAQHRENMRFTSTWCLGDRAPLLLPGSPREALIRIEISRPRLHHHLRGQRGGRTVLVPGLSLEPVADKLLVERG